MENNKYLRFKYELPEELAGIISSTVSDFNESFIIGYLNTQYIGSLNHMGFYLICDSVNLIEGSSGISYTKPLGIIAKNESEAVRIYGKINNTDTSTCLFEIAHNSANIKVEPI